MSDEINMDDTLGDVCKVVVIFVAAIELLLLQAGYMRGVVKWEHIWVISVELFSYVSAFVQPDAKFVTLHLDDGSSVAWLRYISWILTCPVLLMALVEMTTLGKNGETIAPAVRMVPLLTFDQAMILIGASAHACDAPLKWYMFAIALMCGGIVFSSVCQCLAILLKTVASEQERKVALFLTVTFVLGWNIFPFCWVLGTPAFNVMREDVGYMIGDLLSKNCWVAGCVWRKILIDRRSVTEMSHTRDAELGERAAKRRSSFSTMVLDDYKLSARATSGSPSFKAPAQVAPRTATALPAYEGRRMSPAYDAERRSQDDLHRAQQEAAAAAAAAAADLAHKRSRTPSRILQSLTPTRLRTDAHEVLVRDQPEPEVPTTPMTEEQVLAAAQNGPNGRVRRNEQ